MNVSETYEQLLGTKEEILSSLRRTTGCDITDVLAAVAAAKCGEMVTDNAKRAYQPVWQARFIAWETLAAIYLLERGSGFKKCAK